MWLIAHSSLQGWLSPWLPHSYYVLVLWYVVVKYEESPEVNGHKVLYPGRCLWPPPSS
jgi:hypothetical protein